jgi:hypothetical protein
MTRRRTTFALPANRRQPDSLPRSMLARERATGKIRPRSAGPDFSGRGDGAYDDDDDGGAS